MFCIVQAPREMHHGPLTQVPESLPPPLSSCGSLGQPAALFLTCVKMLALVILRVRYVKTLYKTESPMKYRIFLSLFFLITSSQQKHGPKTTWGFFCHCPRIIRLPETIFKVCSKDVERYSKRSPEKIKVRRT